MTAIIERVRYRYLGSENGNRCKWSESGNLVILHQQGNTMKSKPGKKPPKKC